MGGLPYPELSDWHPKGKATQAYGLWNEERGAGNRAVVVVDKVFNDKASVVVKKMNGKPMKKSDIKTGDKVGNAL